MSDQVLTFNSRSVEETQQAAAVLAALVQPGFVIALDGDLGAGKTHFVQGLAKGLSVAGAVTSPTFNVMSAYNDGRVPLYHFDLYRLEDALELEDIAFYDYVESDGVACIEWACKFEDEIPSNALWIAITTTENGERCIAARTSDMATEELARAWFAQLN